MCADWKIGRAESTVKESIKMIKVPFTIAQLHIYFTY